MHPKSLLNYKFVGIIKGSIGSTGYFESATYIKHFRINCWLSEETQECLIAKNTLAFEPNKVRFSRSISKLRYLVNKIGIFWISFRFLKFKYWLQGNGTKSTGTLIISLKASKGGLLDRNIGTIKLAEFLKQSQAVTFRKGSFYTLRNIDQHCNNQTKKNVCRKLSRRVGESNIK